VAWDTIFYATAEGTAPGADFLDGCPAKVRRTILAVLDAVAAAPPPSFSGGGKWEAMHGDMGGYYEIRAAGDQAASSSGCSASSRTPTNALWPSEDYVDRPSP
jgi:hypothetical protein